MDRNNILSKVSSIVFDKYWKSEIKMEIDQMFALFKNIKLQGNSCSQGVLVVTYGIKTINLKQLKGASKDSDKMSIYYLPSLSTQDRSLQLQLSK